MAVSAVQTDRARAQFPGEEGAKLQGWAQLHSHWAGQVILREKGQRCSIDPVLAEILEKKGGTDSLVLLAILAFFWREENLRWTMFGWTCDGWIVVRRTEMFIMEFF